MSGRYNYGFSPYQQNNRNDYQQRSSFRGNSSGYRPSQNNGFRPEPKKHSGCTSGIGKNQQPYIRGWKYGKRTGLMSFFVSPYKGTSKHSSASGNIWYNWMAKVQYADGRSEIFPCLVNEQKNKAILRKMGFVMNTKGGKGGYVGPFFIRK
jgi:hypothetical protein